MHFGEIKERPLVLLTLPSLNDPDGEMLVVAGSTKSPRPENLPFAVKVDGRRGGHPGTGLFEATWFYAGWIRTVKVREVTRFHRFFPIPAYETLKEMIRNA